MSQGMALNGSSSDTECLKKRFLKAAYELHEIGRSVGSCIIPTSDASLPLFSKEPLGKQLSVVKLIEDLAAVYRMTIKEGYSIKNPSSVVWCAFRRFDLVPPSDFFDKLDSRDVIEVYSKEGFHLFANLRFFDLCSYTLEQIYCRPWDQLWFREPSGLQDLTKVIESALHPEQNSTLMFEGLRHSVEELDSPFKYVLDYAIKGIAPIWQKHPFRKVGFVIIERAEVLNLPQPSMEQELLSHFYNSCYELDML